MSEETDARNFDMTLNEKERKGLADLAARLRSEMAAEDILLFGSAATGEMDSESDIDLFVVLPDVNWDVERKVIHMCFDVELEIGRVISPACFSLHDLADTPLRSSPLVLNARLRGVAV